MNSKTQKLLLSLLCVCVGAVQGFAQVTVTGKVTDENGEALPGVGILIKNTDKGVVSELDGTYSIYVSPNDVLTFSCMGYVGQDRKVNGNKTINVVLREDYTSLEESVVVGYGTQKKAHLTGAVAAVGQEEILKTTSSNVSQALVGKLPGIVSQQSVGTPGSDDVTMLVRGYSSYQGTSPLVLVDGVKRPMRSVDAHDIASISVLKDAASCAVYGMDGGSGVILITTKSGSEGRASINYSGSMTFSNATALPKMMNGTQYMQYYNLGRVLDGNEPYFTQEQIDMCSNGDVSDGLENTDWTSTLYKTTTMHQHNLSVNGGNSKVKYFVSGSYLSQNGIIEDHKYQKGGLRSNIEARPVENFRINMNIGGYITDTYVPGGYSYENQKSYSIFHQLLYSLPFVPKEIDGNPVSGYRNASNAANPIYGSANSGFQDTKKLKIETSASAEYSFRYLKGLKASFFFSWDWTDMESKTFAYAYKVLAPDTFGGTSYSWYKSANLLEGGNMYKGQTKIQQLVLRPQLSYNNTFGKHTVGVLFLYEQMTGYSSLFEGARKDFALYDLPYLNFGASSTSTNSESYGHSAQAGYVGRLNYVYDNRYLFEASARYDGSYLFHKDHRWGFFPSVSVGWVMSEEDFFKNAFPEVDRFKLRASIGTLGSKNVSAYQYRKSYSWSANSVAFGNNPTAQNTLYNAVAYPFEDLTWERLRSSDVGFEFSAWNGKLSLEADYFYKYTYNILNTISSVFPSSLGGHYPTQENSGAFDNQGVDLIIKHRNRVGKLNYGLTGTFTYAHNRILSKKQSDNVLPWQSVLGSSVGSIWGYKSDGLYQSQEEIDNAPKPANVTPRVGDIKYVDYNGDGQINTEDMVKISRGTMPEMMFSFQVDADYRGLDLSLQFQGAALCDKMLMGSWYNYSGYTDLTPLTVPWYAGYDNAPLYLVEGSWTPDNTDAEYPRLSVDKSSYSNNALLSDFWKRDGSYLRLKNATLGYTFPSKLLNKVNIDRLRIYLTGTNLFTITEFKYIDPESANVVTGYYPQQRTVSFGIDLSF
ncbi:MAG: SusC/RagA family TonB-linked outer membrane protein [Candidatus Cryptobacteroides sp.]